MKKILSFYFIWLYNFSNTAGLYDDHGTEWTGPHLHLEYTRITK